MMVCSSMNITYKVLVYIFIFFLLFFISFFRLFLALYAIVHYIFFCFSSIFSKVSIRHRQAQRLVTSWCRDLNCPLQSITSHTIHHSEIFILSLAAFACLPALPDSPFRLQKSNGCTVWHRIVYIMYTGIISAYMGLLKSITSVEWVDWKEIISYLLGSPSLWLYNVVYLLTTIAVWLSLFSYIFHVHLLEKTFLSHKHNLIISFGVIKQKKFRLESEERRWEWARKFLAVCSPGAWGAITEDWTERISHPY